MKKNPLSFRTRLAPLCAVLLILLCFNLLSRAAELEEDSIRLLDGFTSFSAFPRDVTWESTAPQVQTVEIKSSVDGSIQHSLYYDSGSDCPKPLLVVLHSWSDDYRQKISIPYAVWAEQNDWVFIHPDYRGVFNNPQATGSELAVRDIIDAVEFAMNCANIDPCRIYLVGFSGGAMMSLIMAGRYPELWTAVAAWVPVFNLTDWYRYVQRFPNRHYARHIIASCGGAPEPGTDAAAECDKRSPSSYLKNARCKDLHIYIAHGISDDFAPPGNSLRAFNELAAPADRISEEDIEYIDSRSELPPQLQGEYADTVYDDAGSRMLFQRTSQNATVTLFKGRHDVLYNVGLQWLSQQIGS